MVADSIKLLPLQQKARLKHIELRLRFLGEVRRPDLMQRFGIQSAAASRDLSLYRELAPGNIDYDSSGKRYLLGASFVPLFPASSEQVLSWLAERLGDVTAPTSDSLLPCLSPTQLSHPHPDVLACVTRAIHLERVLRIRYYSITKGELRLDIVPFALLDTGMGWHVRAFDRIGQQFRGFALTRIKQPELLLSDAPQLHELPEQDVQWTRLVELDLVPHPDQPSPEITRMEYGIPSGVLRLKLRAAMAGHVLRRWSVDCSPDHRLRGPEYRLWLRDHLALYGVSSARFAPGYKHDQGEYRHG